MAVSLIDKGEIVGSQDHCLSVALVQTVSDNSHSYQKRNIMELTSQAYQACYLDALWLSITVAPGQPAKFTPRILFIFEIHRGECSGECSQ